MKRALDRLLRVRTFARNRARARLAAARADQRRAQARERAAAEGLRGTGTIRHAAECDLAAAAVWAARTRAQHSDEVARVRQEALAAAEVEVARREAAVARRDVLEADRAAREEARELDDWVLASILRRGTRLVLAGALALAPASCSSTAEEDVPGDTTATTSGGSSGASDGGSRGGSGDDGATPAADTAAKNETTSDALPTWMADLPEDHPLRRAHADLAARTRATLASQADSTFALAKERAAIDRARKELDGRLAKIAELMAELDKKLGEGEEARRRRRARIQALAGLLAGMTPQGGASIVANMSDQDAQDVLLALATENQRKAAKLLAAMPPARAAAIGERYLSHDPEAAAQRLRPTPPAPSMPPAETGTPGTPKDAAPPTSNPPNTPKKEAS